MALNPGDRGDRARSRRRLRGQLATGTGRPARSHSGRAGNPTRPPDLNAVGRDGSKTRREDMKKEMEVILSGFPDARTDIDDLIADGDKVATRVTVTGTHTKDSKTYGSPTGRRLTFAMMGIDRIANGKIVESWW